MTTGLPIENIYAHTKKLSFILEKIANYKKNKVEDIFLLDFGCGNGSAVSQYLIQDGVRYYGVDFHQPSIEFAKKNYENPNATFQMELPQNMTFDIIVYADILEHLENPLELLQQHYPLLKNNGIIIISIPNGYGPFENEKRITKYTGVDFLYNQSIYVYNKYFKRNKNYEKIPYNLESGHLQFFTKKSINSLLAKAKYQITDFRHGGFLGANISERFILRGQKVAKMNAKVSDKLPSWMVSSWYISAIKIIA